MQVWHERSVYPSSVTRRRMLQAPRIA